MAILKFLRRDRPDAARVQARGPSSAEAVQQVRRVARRRLIGAVVLLGIGVIGFPLVFQTQPRPIPVDIPIDIPRKDGLPPLAVTPAAGAGDLNAGSAGMPPPNAALHSGAPVGPAVGLVETTGASPQAGAPAPVAVAATPTPTVTGAPERAQEKVIAKGGERTGDVPTGKTTERVAEKPTPKTIERVVERELPRPAADKPVERVAERSADKHHDKGVDKHTDKHPDKVPEKSVEKANDRAAAPGRFAVQAGAYSDAEVVQEVRGRLERLGFRTFVQGVEVDGAMRTRVRIGPFATRQEAQDAAQKVKAAGLAASLVPL